MFNTNISRCYQWHLSLTHKRRAHIHRFTFTIKIRIRQLCLFERTSKNCYSFESFIRMNLGNGFKLRNCIINHQLSQICLYTNWTCFNQCFSSSFRSVHQGLWLHQGVLYWIHITDFTICWYCSLYGLESFRVCILSLNEFISVIKIGTQQIF